MRNYAPCVPPVRRCRRCPFLVGFGATEPIKVFQERGEAKQNKEFGPTVVIRSRQRSVGVTPRPRRQCPWVTPGPHPSCTGSSNQRTKHLLTSQAHPRRRLHISKNAPHGSRHVARSHRGQRMIARGATCSGTCAVARAREAGRQRRSARTRKGGGLAMSREG